MANQGFKEFFALLNARSVDSLIGLAVLSAVPQVVIS